MDMKAAMCLELKSLESDSIALGKTEFTKKTMMIFIFSQKNHKSGGEKIIDGSRGSSYNSVCYIRMF